MSPRGRERSSTPPAPRKGKRSKLLMGGWGRRLGCLALLVLVSLVPAAIYVTYLSHEIAKTFEGGLWQLPSRVYSAPLLVRQGEAGGAARIRTHLDMGNYARTLQPPMSPGQYRQVGNVLEISQRGLSLPGREWPRMRLRIELGRGGRVLSIRDLGPRRSLRSVELEPQAIVSFFGRSREERTILPLSAYPKHVIDAVLAAEDQRFLSHHGIDPLGIARAAWENMLNRSVVQGGSTITQQTVKNLYLTNKRSLGRKLKEALMSVILEARYPKERILEVYLNEVYLGQRGDAAICGFGEASRFYFGKEAADLDVGEAAMLAGIIRAPSAYNPISHPDRALQRKNAVVQQMLQQGRIDADRARRATAASPALSKGATIRPEARYFVDLVRRELQADAEIRPDVGGLRILTTLDTWLQERAEVSLRQGLEDLEQKRPALRKRGGGRLEGCLVALKPSTGEILALVGGRGYAKSQFDRVTQARRQPGSLFKPFVYATGFEQGREDTGEPFTPATVLEDEPLVIPVSGKDWEPQNYDGEYRGPITARQALEESINVPTVRAAVAIGLDKIAKSGEVAGLGQDLKAYPSIALGAQEVTPLDAAAAFALFANGGKRPHPHAVVGIIDEEGRVLARGETRMEKVYSPQATYLTLDLLRGVVNRGTAASLRGHGILGDVAGKTGTTNDKRDSWFVGFRPGLLVLVWVGFDDFTETHLSGAQGALPIWESYMHAIGEWDSSETFERPEGILLASVDPETGGLATENCPQTVEEVFIDGSLPPDCPHHGVGAFRRFWRHIFGRGGKEPQPPPPPPEIE